MFRCLVFVLAVLASASVPAWAQAEVRLPSIFSNHMVFQQDAPIRVFGWSAPGQQIKVTLKDAVGTTTSDLDGRWLVELPAMKADGERHTLTVTGANTLEFKDVALGEVWICSGQSNMEWALERSLNGASEVTSARHPNLRLFDVPRHIASEVANPDTPGEWKRCSPQNAGKFSAVGYFFGRNLTLETKVPVGLIGTNWGGTRIEPWTPPVGFEQVPELSRYAKWLRQLEPNTEEWRTYNLGYLDRVEKWVAEGRRTIAAGGTLSGPPGRLDFAEVEGATTIYNGMVHGLAPFSVKGVIWYQGESNAKDGLAYAKKKEALVAGWRSVFKNPELSFYWVQLANFQKPSEDPAGGGWGPVREAQRLALAIPHTGMAVTIDVGNEADIHPRNKQDVGARLARWALRDHYGKKDLVVSGPLFRSATLEGNRVRIAFDSVGSGLMIGAKSGLDPTKPTEGVPLKRFSVRGSDGGWVWAHAEIDGNTVLVKGDNIDTPTAVRYAYESNPEGANLYNREGLPASPFDTGPLVDRSVARWVTYEGKESSGRKKHVVLISGDEEYRSEEALPQLGKILAIHHGFRCTVLFAIDPDTGMIDPNNARNIPGLEALATADLMIIATRFRDLPEDQMKYIDDYLISGRPVLGMRTATHAFNIQAEKPYARYGNGYRGEETAFEGGFGRLVLGEKWISHHGNHKREGCLGILTEAAVSHPITRGLKNGDVWGPTDVYGVRLPLPGDSLPLVLGQVQKDVRFDPEDRWFGMRPTDPPLDDGDRKNNPMMPIAWTKSYQLPNGKLGQAFTTTMGAATDLEAEGTRRLLVNAAYYLMGLEVPPRAEVSIIGTFEPTPYGFGGFKRGVPPSAHALR